MKMLVISRAIEAYRVQRNDARRVQSSIVSAREKLDSGYVEPEAAQKYLELVDFSRPDGQSIEDFTPYKNDRVVANCKALLGNGKVKEATESLKRLTMTYGAPNGVGHDGGITDALIAALSAEEDLVVLVEVAQSLKAEQDRDLADPQARMEKFIEVQTTFADRYPDTFLNMIHSKDMAYEYDAALRAVDGHSQQLAWIESVRSNLQSGTSEFDHGNDHDQS